MNYFIGRGGYQNNGYRSNYGGGGGGVVVEEVMVVVVAEVMEVVKVVVIKVHNNLGDMDLKVVVMVVVNQIIMAANNLLVVMGAKVEVVHMEINNKAIIVNSNTVVKTVVAVMAHSNNQDNMEAQLVMVEIRNKHQATNLVKLKEDIIVNQRAGNHNLMVVRVMVNNQLLHQIMEQVVMDNRLPQARQDITKVTVVSQVAIVNLEVTQMLPHKLVVAINHIRVAMVHLLVRVVMEVPLIVTEALKVLMVSSFYLFFKMKQRLLSCFYNLSNWLSCLKSQFNFVIANSF